jgi:penicillin G amidase
MHGWRNVFGVAASLFLIALFSLIGFLLASLPAPKEEKRVAGLGAPAQVLFDGDGVPYIFAPDADSAAFALGYAHARDRMWQMELQRRLAQGRLSELFGERSLAVDRQYRTLGLQRAAEESVGALDTAVLRHLQAYADGVNAWIEKHEGAWPLEFTALGHRPEPWRPADSVAWSKVMALRLSGNYQGELLRLRLAGRLPPDKIEELWPSYPSDGPVTVTTSGAASSPPAPERPVYALDVEMPSGEPRRGASNVWAVAGARTETGKPILANDPHLGFAAPIIWYLARVSTPQSEVVGGTLPGLPYVVVGHNGRIAWGITTTESDLQDAVIERLTDDGAQRYDTPEGPRPFIQHVERIKVKDRPDVELTVHETRHGPVIAAEPMQLGDGRSAVVALQATFMSAADTGVQALHNLNRARSKEEFVAGRARRKSSWRRSPIRSARS